ncbi:hypothetical protein Tco_1316602 [Tanacetum coccineum]
MRNEFEGVTDCIMADFVFANQVFDSTDRAPSLLQQDIVMTNATIETTTLEVAAPQYDVETLEVRVDVAELRVEILQLALVDAREEIMDLRTRVSALE